MIQPSPQPNGLGLELHCSLLELNWLQLEQLSTGYQGIWYNPHPSPMIFPRLPLYLMEFEGIWGQYLQLEVFSKERNRHTAHCRSWVKHVCIATYIIHCVVIAAIRGKHCHISCLYCGFPNVNPNKFFRGSIEYPTLQFVAILIMMCLLWLSPEEIPGHMTLIPCFDSWLIGNDVVVCL
jgi:hypothetical protein